MNKKHFKTLQKIFDRPTRSDIEWLQIRSLLTGCGADIREGRGSRVRIVLNRRVLSLHTPHPGKEMKKYAVRLVRDFLEISGVRPL